MTGTVAEDGAILNSDTIVEYWNEDLGLIGGEWISLATGVQGVHEMLYLTKRGQFYIVRVFIRERRIPPKARSVTYTEAINWLLLNKYTEFPIDPSKPDFSNLPL